VYTKPNPDQDTDQGGSSKGPNDPDSPKSPKGPINPTSPDDQDPEDSKGKKLKPVKVFRSMVGDSELKFLGTGGE
jgi:hypothetical protein